MKVCFVTGEYPPMQGGVGDYTSVLASTLASQGIEACVLTSVQVASGLPGQGTETLPVVHGWGWGSLSAVARQAKRMRAEVVHLQYQAALYQMRMPVHFLPRFLTQFGPAVPLVVTFHDLRVPYLFPKAGPLRRWALIRLARDADAVILTNREDELQVQGWSLERPACLIPIGSNIQPQLPPGFDRAAWRAGWGIGADEIVLAYFGFLNATKGGHTLIASLHELVRRGVNARLIMIGGKVGASDATNARFVTEVEAQIDGAGLAERVIWTGHMPGSEVSAAFAASDMAVLPYSDGISFRRGSLMAALAHGIPVISTVPQIDLPELIPEQNILLVAPEQPGEIADAVMRVANHAGLRTRLGEGARRLSQLFAWGGIAQQTVALYEDLLRTSPSS